MVCIMDKILQASLRRQLYYRLAQNAEGFYDDFTAIDVTSVCWRRHTDFNVPVLFSSENGR